MKHSFGEGLGDGSRDVGCPSASTRAVLRESIHPQTPSSIPTVSETTIVPEFAPATTPTA
jgi:hypothetical protein